MSARKSQWSKPQLIVLGRGKPEENVLVGCKFSSYQGIGPGSGNCKIGNQNCSAPGSGAS